MGVWAIEVGALLAEQSLQIVHALAQAHIAGHVDGLQGILEVGFCTIPLHHTSWHGITAQLYLWPADLACSVPGPVLLSLALVLHCLALNRLPRPVKMCMSTSGRSLT